MSELKESAILLSLIEHLRACGSWCGETHVQKSTYFLKVLLQVPLSFDFILYKYGPYSFDLSDQLVAMRADSLIRLLPNDPYGPSLAPGEVSEQLKRQFARTLRNLEPHITFVVNHLALKTVSELEAISTALYVHVNEEGGLSTERHATLLRELKPHIQPEASRRAVRELDGLILESSKSSFLQSVNT